MNKMSGWKKFFGCLVVGLTMTGGAFAQQLAGVSFTYEMFPLNTWGSVAAFPLILAQGKTILVSAVEYQNTVYDFEDWGYAQGSTGDTERFHAVGSGNSVRWIPENLSGCCGSADGAGWSRTR